MLAPCGILLENCNLEKMTKKHAPNQKYKKKKRVQKHHAKNANKMQSQKCSSHFSCILILNLGFCICFSKIMFVWSDLHFFGFAIFLLSYIFSELMFVQLVPGLICIFLHASLFFFVFCRIACFKCFFWACTCNLCLSQTFIFCIFVCIISPFLSRCGHP